MNQDPTLPNFFLILEQLNLELIYGDAHSTTGGFAGTWLGLIIPPPEYSYSDTL